MRKTNHKAANYSTLKGKSFYETKRRMEKLFKEQSKSFNVREIKRELDLNKDIVYYILRVLIGENQIIQEYQLQSMFGKKAKKSPINVYRRK